MAARLQSENKIGTGGHFLRSKTVGIVFLLMYWAKNRGGEYDYTANSEPVINLQVHYLSFELSRWSKSCSTTLVYDLHVPCSVIFIPEPGYQPEVI